MAPPSFVLQLVVPLPLDGLVSTGPSGNCHPALDRPGAVVVSAAASTAAAKPKATKITCRSTVYCPTPTQPKGIAFAYENCPKPGAGAGVQSISYNATVSSTGAVTAKLAGRDDAGKQGEFAAHCVLPRWTTCRRSRLYAESDSHTTRRPGWQTVNRPLRLWATSRSLRVHKVAGSERAARAPGFVQHERWARAVSRARSSFVSER